MPSPPHSPHNNVLNTSQRSSIIAPVLSITKKTMSVTLNKGQSDDNFSILSGTSNVHGGVQHHMAADTDGYEIPSTKDLFKDEGGTDLMDELNSTPYEGRLGSNKKRLTNEQKTTQKEKNLYQMINMLSMRLASLDSLVEERRAATREDLNPNSDMRSSQLKKLVEDNPGTHLLGIPPKPPASAAASGIGVAPGPVGALPNRGAGGGSNQQEGRENLGIFGPVRLAYRHTAATEAGRRLETQFELIMDDAPTGGQGRPSNATNKKKEARDTKAKYEAKVMESRKQERATYERKLQANLDEYVTRVVNEVVYRVPSDGGSDCSSVETNIIKPTTSGANNNSATPGDAKPKTPATAAFALNESDVRIDDGEELNAERWPIPVEPTQMNPRLLLGYACERIMLQGQQKNFRRLAVSPLSCRVFVWMYWFMHCKFFQEHSQAEQIHLLQRLSRTYSQFIATYPSAKVDFFFSNYPYMLANAIIWGFYYLCPGSRHLYNATFKRILYLQTVITITGHHVCPASVQIMRHRLFPDDAQEEEDDGEDVLPALPKSKAKKLKGHLASLFSTTDSDDDGSQANANANLSMSGTLPVTVDAPHSVETDGPFTGRGAGAAASHASEGLENGGIKSQLGAGSQLASENGDRESVNDYLPYSRQSDQPAVAMLVSERKDLRFRPRQPEKLTALWPRQHRESFEASRTSPLLQEHLGAKQASSRRPENIRMTFPVRWCQTGGVETYHHHSHIEPMQPFAKKYQENVEEYRQAYVESMKQLRKAKRAIKAEKESIIAKRGTIKFERFTLDLVNEIASRGVRRMPSKAR